MATWLETLITLRANRADAADLFGAVFELPMRLAAELSGSPAETSAWFAEFGASLGRLFSYVEDGRASWGLRTRLDASFDGLVSSRLINLDAPSFTTLQSRKDWLASKIRQHETNCHAALDSIQLREDVVDALSQVITTVTAGPWRG